MAGDTGPTWPSVCERSVGDRGWISCLLTRAHGGSGVWGSPRPRPAVMPAAGAPGGERDESAGNTGPWGSCAHSAPTCAVTASPSVGVHKSLQTGETHADLCVNITRPGPGVPGRQGALAEQRSVSGERPPLPSRPHSLTHGSTKPRAGLSSECRWASRGAAEG